MMTCSHSLILIPKLFTFIRKCILMDQMRLIELFLQTQKIIKWLWVFISRLYMILNLIFEHWKTLCDAFNLITLSCKNLFGLLMFWGKLCLLFSKSRNLTCWLSQPFRMLSLRGILIISNFFEFNSCFVIIFYFCRYAFDFFSYLAMF